MNSPLGQDALSAKAKAQARNADVGIVDNSSRFATEKLTEPDTSGARSLTRREALAAGGRFNETYDASNHLDDARIAYVERTIRNKIATICPGATSLLVTYSGNYDVGGVGRQALNDEFGNAVEDFDKFALSDVISLYGEVFEHEETLRSRSSFEGTGVAGRYALILKQDHVKSLTAEIKALDRAEEEIKKQRNAAAVELIAEIVTKVHPTAAGVRTYQDSIENIVDQDGVLLEYQTGLKGPEAAGIWGQIFAAEQLISPDYLENVTESGRDRFTIWF